MAWLEKDKDLNLIYKNKTFLGNYIHSNPKNFVSVLNLRGEKIEENKESVLNTFKKEIIKILEKELRFFRKVEKEYIKNLGINPKTQKPFKNIEEARLRHQELLESDFDNSVFPSFVNVAEASVKTTEEGKIIKKGLGIKTSIKKATEKERDAYWKLFNVQLSNAFRADAENLSKILY